MTLTASQLLLLAGVGVLAGIINGIVGSGTLLVFPLLVAMGLPPVIANGTNSAGLWPGSFAATWPSRGDLWPRRKRLWSMALLAFVFGLFGALLVIVLPSSVFSAVVPWLIGGAVLLVAVQPWLVARLAARDAGRSTPDGPPKPSLLAAVAGAATYSGYFGAAQGVILLGVLGVLDDTDPRRANGVKNLLASMANTASTIVFVSTGRVVWPAALALMGASMVGGYIGGHGAKRLPVVVFRILIIGVGLFALVSLIVRH
ncbi:MAG TPA: sulfite exporter TauE/SafE family protein [Candidatus Nanopelagicales bacterium]|nr:sulfite exporter TauE/SafE family protein [Candidatus Nanopelagicales bacterium]